MLLRWRTCAWEHGVLRAAWVTGLQMMEACEPRWSWFDSFHIRTSSKVVAKAMNPTLLQVAAGLDFHSEAFYFVQTELHYPRRARLNFHMASAKMDLVRHRNPAKFQSIMLALFNYRAPPSKVLWVVLPASYEMRAWIKASCSLQFL